MPKIWLLTSAQTTERDNRNLTLAIDYWIFDEKVADRLLAAGVKNYGIIFLHGFNIRQIEYTLLELLTG